MLQNYLDMVLCDTETALVTLAVFAVGAAAAFWLRRKQRSVLLRWLLGIAVGCPVLAAALWHLDGSFGGRIGSMTLCLFGLPILAGLAAGWLAAAQWPRIRQHRIAAAVLALLLAAVVFWAWPRRLWQTGWWDRYGVEYDPTYPSRLGLALTTEDGGESWQLAAIRDGEQVSQAVGILRCGPTLPLPFGLPDDLPDRQLLIPLSYGCALLATDYGPAYLCADDIPWQDFSSCSHLETFTFRPGSGSRVLHYPALYDELAVWLTDAGPATH